jgi:hypothetical protein
VCRAVGLIRFRTTAELYRRIVGGTNIMIALSRHFFLGTVD